MSMFTGYAYDAFRDARGEVRRRRSELAQAFEQYKKNNPYATYEDYQNFIDSQLDFGENYLRGGVASDNLLRRLANENAERQEKDEQLTRMEEAMQKLRLADQFGDSSQRFLGSTDSLTGDQDAFLGALGINRADYDPAAFQDMYGTDPLVNLTEAKRSSVLQARMAEMQPQVDSYIGSLDGNVTVENIRSRFPNLIMPDADIQTLISNAEQNALLAADEIRMNYVDRFESYLDKFPDVDPKVALDAFNAMAGRQLQSATGRKGFELEEIQPQLDAYTQRKAREEEERTRAAKGKLATQIDSMFSNEAVQRAILEDKNDALQTLAMQLETRLTPQELQDAFGLDEGQSIPTDSPVLKEIYDQYFDVAKNKLEESAEDRRQEIRNQVPGLTTAALNDNKDKLVSSVQNATGNESLAKAIVATMSRDEFDTSSPAYRSALNAFRETYMRGRDLSGELDGDDVNELARAFRQTMQDYQVPDMSGRVDLLQQSTEERNRVYRVERPTDTIEREVAETREMVEQDFKPVVDRIRMAIDSGNIDQASRLIQMFQMQQQDVALRVSRAAQDQYNAQPKWALQRAPEDFAAQISGSFAESISPYAQEVQRMAEEVTQALNSGAVVANDLVRYSNEEIAAMDQIPLNQQSERITQSIDRNLSLIDSVLDIQSGGEIAEERFVPIQMPGGFVQPVFEEMRAFTGRGDDRFLSVQQVNNAQDKKTQLLDSNNRNNIVYRLGVSTPETAFALIADMKNPDISWDEISSKYQLGQDLSQGDIANRRSQYTTEELLGSVVRQIQRQ
tara:strand:+ start:825 stop:3200 length:2376 start_codon:yes stop_codon:yes gene_type:complete